MTQHNNTMRCDTTRPQPPHAPRSTLQGASACAWRRSAHRHACRCCSRKWHGAPGPGQARGRRWEAWQRGMRQQRMRSGQQLPRCGDDKMTAGWTVCVQCAGLGEEGGGSAVGEGEKQTKKKKEHNTRARDDRTTTSNTTNSTHSQSSVARPRWRRREGSPCRVRRGAAGR